MLKERESLERSSPCSLGSSGLDVVSCAGCGGRIHDRYYLLAVDRQWHAHCLKCCECKLPLDTELTCFARDGNIYCKEDYYRMFAVSRCGRCHAGISANELVMRARDLVYHLHCFSCTSCGVPLSKGDHFGMREGLVYCRPHYELLDYCDPPDPMDLVYRGGESPGYYPATPPHHHQKGRPRKRKLGSDGESTCGEMPVTMRMSTLEMLQQGDLSSSMESLAYDSSVTSPASSTGQQSQRTKRMRTSFKHHQLRTMKTYFAINQNPDAKDLKQLAQKTGLSKRVLQVWFQNARAKWRRNLMRQEGGGGGQVTPNGPTSGGPSPSTPGMIDSTIQQHQSSLEDIHRHIHQNSQTLNFGDIY
ncbi:LIM/homeobox protein Lhx9-like [Onthophagus taurus]|nr:LIM/homeobox protein Lhx9-like [Onthophagus taurus]